MLVRDLKINASASLSSQSNSSLAAFAWKWGVPFFALLAMVVLLATGSNVLVFEYLNQLLAPAGDAWWSHVSVLGDTSLALMCLLLLIGRRPDLAWQLVLAALFATLWAHGGKEMFSSLRPPAVLHAGTFHLIGYMLEHNSFPSGHTTTVFVLAGLVCAQPWDARYKTLALMLATLIGLSRIACGVHWPLDVLGGVFGGWLSALAGIWLAQHWHAGLNVWFQRVLALMMTALVFWSIFFYDNGFPNTWLFQSLLSLSALLYSLKSLYRLFKFN